MVAVVAMLAALACGRVAYAQDITIVRNEGIPSVPISYKVGIEVDVTNDADGWEDAYITLSTIGDNGRGHSKFNLRETEYFNDLASDFDNNQTSYYETYCGNCFPEYVQVYTNFGGGMTSRRFEADVTVFVNDINVASKHIVAKSGVWSESDTTNTIEIGRDKFPYLDILYLDAPESVWSDYNKAEVRIYALGVDQYGEGWYYRLNDSDAAGSTTLRFYKSGGSSVPSMGTVYELRWDLQEKGPADQRVTYVVEAPSANEINPLSTASFDISYEFARKVEIRCDELVDTQIGAANQELVLDYPELVQPGNELEWTLEGGGVLVPNGEQGPTYVFGDTDGVLTAANVPYSYQLAFDGNGATGGKMSTRVVRVGTRFYLPSNMFSRTGYVFAGWSTEPDGGGDTYENKAIVQDLATEKDAVVTLYAQWEIKSYTVTFVNKFTNERITQTVEYGSAAEAPYIEAGVPIDDQNHNAFVKWNKDFSNIKANTTVTSTHKTMPHEFEQGEDGVVRCAVCGYTPQDSNVTASVFGDGSGSMIVVGIGAVLCAGAAVYAIVLKRRRTQAE